MQVQECLIILAWMLYIRNKSANNYQGQPLAHIKNALLITDDSGMHEHAEEYGVDSVLIREIELDKLKKLI